MQQASEKMKPLSPKVTQRMWDKAMGLICERCDKYRERCECQCPKKK